jgi:hypothetical protein
MIPILRAATAVGSLAAVARRSPYQEREGQGDSKPDPGFSRLSAAKRQNYRQSHQYFSHLEKLRQVGFGATTIGSRVAVVSNSKVSQGAQATALRCKKYFGMRPGSAI